MLGNSTYQSWGNVTEQAVNGLQCRVSPLAHTGKIKAEGIADAACREPILTLQIILLFLWWDALSLLLCLCTAKQLWKENRELGKGSGCLRRSSTEKAIKSSV